MEGVAVFVGLDYLQDSVQVYVLDSGCKVLSNRTCDNDPTQAATPTPWVASSRHMLNPNGVGKAAKPSKKDV